MDWITNPETWISLVTLTLLEIVLGIDNIVFISILAGKLPAGASASSRRWLRPVGLSCGLKRQLHAREQNFFVLLRDRTRVAAFKIGLNVVQAEAEIAV